MPFSRTQKVRPFRRVDSGARSPLDAALKLLRSASNWFDGKDVSADDVQSLANRGTGSDAAQFGSTAGEDTNDPGRSPHDGTDYVWLPGTADNALSMSDAPSLRLDGSMELWFDGAATSWVPDSFQYLVNKGTGGPGGQSYGLRIQAGGNLLFLTSDGTTLTATNSGAPVPFAAGQRGQIRVLYDDVAEEVTFQTRLSDSDSWDELATVAHSVVSIQGNAESLRIGSNAGLANCFGGFVYRASVTDGIGGTVVATLDPSTQIDTNTDPNAGQTSVGGWTVNRSATGLKTTVVTRPVAVLDGVDDFIQLPASATPTFTSTTGKHTVVVAFRKHGVASGFERLYSSESVEPNGLFIRVASGTRTMVATVGGLGAATSRIFGDYADGEIAVAASIVDDGTLRGYGPDGYTAAAVSTTGVGTITHAAPRIGSRADAVANESNTEFFAVLDFPGVALTEAELDLIAAKLIAGSYT